jgi:hypothetical protein
MKKIIIFHLIIGPTDVHAVDRYFYIFSLLGALISHWLFGSGVNTGDN